MDDWKLKGRAVVKLKKKCSMFVTSYLRVVFILQLHSVNEMRIHTDGLVYSHFGATDHTAGRVHIRTWHDPSCSSKCLYTWVTLTEFILAVFAVWWPSYGWLYVKFSLATGGSFTLTPSRGWFPANVAINDIKLKLDSFSYISLVECISVFSTTFT